MTRTGILPSFSPSAMIAVMLIFVAVVTTLTPTWAVNGDCSLAVNVTTANWHDSSTWSGCTGSNGLPGTNESVSLSGEGVVITIQANKAAVAITYLYVGDYARLLNHGDLTVSYEIDIEDGGEVTSDGSLAIVSTEPISGQPELYISFGHLAHTGDLVIGASKTTSNESISAYFYANSAKVEIGGSLSLLSTETGSAGFQGSGSHIKTGGTFRMTGGTGSTQWSGSELDIDIVEGNLALGTWDAATYANYTGSVSVSMSLGTILLRRGSLLLESGSAKGDGYSGSVYSNLNTVNVAVAGAVAMKSGDVNAQAYGNGAGYVGFDMYTGSFAVTAVDGVEGSGSMLLQGGNGGAGSSTDSGGSGAYLYWEAQLVHLSVAKDVTLIGGNGGSSNSSNGGQGGSAYFGSNGNVVNAVIGGNLYISSGDGGSSTFGQGGDTYGAYLEFYNGGSLSVGGDVVLNDGNSGSGVNGGYVYSGFFELENSAKMTVGGSFKMGSATAGSSTGGGYGGSCESPDRKKKRSTTDADADKKSDNKRGISSSNGPVYIYQSNLEVTGDMTITLCNAGNGLGGNGGNAWEDTYFSVGTGSTVAIGGSLTWNGGNGGHAVNTTAHPTTSYLYGGYGAYKYLVAGGDVVFTVSGDVVLSAGSGGNVTGASGTSGTAGSVVVEAAAAGTFNIDGDLKMIGAKAGSVSAASIADSTGQPGSACGLVAYSMQEGVINVGGDVHMSGCDAGTVATQVATSLVKKKRTLNLPVQFDMANVNKRGFFGGDGNGEAAVVSYLSSKFVVGGSVTLIGGIGSDATVNDAISGGIAALGAQGDSSIHIEGTTTITAGRGGDSDDAYGGDAGYAAVIVVGTSQLRTGDLTIKGARAGQGLNSTLDGQFGPAALMLQQEGQYQQYGQVTVTEGSYRDYNVSLPTGSTLSYVGASESSQWTIMPCATGGVSYSSSNSSTFSVTKASTFRDCRGSGATIQSRPVGDISSDVSCLGCTCTGDVLLFDECGSGAMLQSAAHQMLVAVLEAVAGLW